VAAVVVGVVKVVQTVVAVNGGRGSRYKDDDGGVEMVLGVAGVNKICLIFFLFLVFE